MTRILHLVAAATLLVLWSSQTATAQSDPAEVAQRVADRLVTDTIFDLGTGLAHGEQEGFYYVDFFDALDRQDGPYYARTAIAIDTSLSEDEWRNLGLGIAFSTGDLSIDLEDSNLFSGSGDQSDIQHLDYGIVRPPIVRPLGLEPGIHELSIRYDPTGSEARLRLGLVRLDNEVAFDGAELRLPEGMDAGEPIRFLVSDNSDDWVTPRVHLVSQLPADAFRNSTFIPVDDRFARRDRVFGYADWRYFTGTFLDALYDVSDTFQELDYVRYIEAHMDNFLRLKPIVERERRIRGLIESPFGHYFRFALLDDMGMQTVPFAERLKRNPGGTRARSDQEIVDESLDHILNGASRLDDGTWARLNPDSLTIWADDLFMGSILLNRLGYFDESAHQVVMMDQYLRDEPSNLYWHGYFASTGEHSSSKWGRANGWTMMAKTDLLMRMPEDHPKRAEVLEIFQRHAAGLLAVQSDDGRWHQILDNPDTYLETSCTAMFTRAFAEGIARGWLEDEAFRIAAEKGWAAVSAQVRPDGRVEGIVRGTPIFFSDDEYENWATRLNDPRGLGAVLHAASAMSRMLQQ